MKRRWTDSWISKRGRWLLIFAMLVTACARHKDRPRAPYVTLNEIQVLNVFSTAGASILAVGYLLPMVYLLWSMRYGQVADKNPWGAAGLEWMIASPPSTSNFDAIPTVTWEVYNYHELQEVPVERH